LNPAGVTIQHLVNAGNACVDCIIKQNMKQTLVNLLLGLAALFWGASFIITKEIFDSEPHITVLHLITFRMVCATAVTLPLLAALRRLEPVRRGDLKWFLLLAFAEPFLYSFCETSGVQRVSGSLSAVIVATIPFFVALANAAVYRERLHSAVLCGVLLSVGGIGLLVQGNGALAASPETLRSGVAYLAAAVAIAVVYTLVLVRVADRYRAVTITAWQNLFGLCYFLPVMLLHDGATLPLITYSPRLILLVLALGILCSTVAYIFYNHGVQHLGATAACVYTNFIPIFSFLTAIAIGQEHFSWQRLAGIALVIAGATLAQLPERPKRSGPSRNQ